MNISIHIDGISQVEAKLRRLGPGLSQLDEAMRQIGEYMATYFGNEAFASQGQVFGATWPRLNMQYSIWKAKHFPGRRPEERTGRMRSSFAFSSGSSSVNIGNNAPYFKFQQGGTSRGLPARPMMGANVMNKRMISDILHEEIRKKLV